ncbi:MAG: twin-arginine translocase TatA/TatE family subunit [Chloroflexota bacterium]|nr:twin-arginine translocase TatA/TatE family subunit [Chloroflexota bacterium]MDE2920212.1 twin-arginine translocase TatA/TatE family subunit [Chloroflexota bacterium]
MPFNVGPFELIIILLIVIAVFGAGRIAGIGRALGTSVREFREEARNEDEEGEGEGEGEDEATGAAGETVAAADDAEAPPAKKKEETTN